MSAELTAPPGVWELLADAEVVDLGHMYRVGMPQSPNHPPFRMTLERRHGDMIRADGGSAANEIVVLGCHVGTHMDALAHVSHDGNLHGGVPAVDVQKHTGFSLMGIDHVKPYVGRAVLLDVPAVKGVEVLDPGYEITVDDLEAAREHSGAQIEPGQVLIVGTGWSHRWEDRDAFIGNVHGVPGPGAAAGAWLASKRPRVVGGETIAFEQVPAGRGHALLPVHRILLVEHGINIVETMNLSGLLGRGIGEFVIVLNPLNLGGATGAPVRPLAVLPGTAGAAHD